MSFELWALKDVLSWGNGGTADATDTEREGELPKVMRLCRGLSPGSPTLECKALTTAPHRLLESKSQFTHLSPGSVP